MSTATATITITVNGELRQLAPGMTLADLIASLTQQPQMLATAVNGEFVPREARASVALSDGDAAFTFQPITGG